MTINLAHSFMSDEWGSFQFTTSADAKRAEHMFNRLSSENDELVAIIKLYLLTAERGTLVKGRKKMELADIDAEARSILAKYGR